MDGACECTRAVQRGDATVPTDGKENEAAQQSLVYPLTPAAQQAGEAGATAAIRSSGFGTPQGNFSMVYMPSISKGAQLVGARPGAAVGAQAGVYSPLPAVGAGEGVPSLGALRPAPAPPTIGSLRPAPALQF